MTTLIQGAESRPRWSRASAGVLEAARSIRSRATTEPVYRLAGWEPAALFVLVLLMVFCGLVELYSASALMAQEEGLPAHYYALRQFLGVPVGFLLAGVLAKADYRALQRFAWPMIGATILALIIIVMPGTEAIAPTVNGARRWIHLGVSIQPSEFAKITLIVWTAALAVKKQERLHSFRKGLLPFLVVWFAVALPVLMQPNFSAAVLLPLLAALVLFAGGARIGHFILLGMVTVPLAWNQIQSAGYRMRRIIGFLDPMADPNGVTYQIHQSLIAVGSGGITGMGLGGSRQKFGFLPELHNDFLFSMIGEEWGLIGVCFILTLFIAFGLLGYRIARGAPDLFGYLLAVGMTNLIVVSALLHMGVALALLPTTGVNLPFMSYGRSGLLIAFIAVGMLLSVARASLRSVETKT
ncbi:MAG: putative lipid II flippase FtsW [Gemmatimonadota bacterium]|jgi:cell division protein FtsW|nr:putative lipid II flippase FtsW [Gemmatimonadota bacterium]